MNKPRVISLIVTLLIALIAIVVMINAHLEVGNYTPGWPPQRVNDVALVEDEMLFEVVEMPRPLPSSYDEAKPALNEVVDNNHSTPEPASGTDLQDRGSAGKPVPPVTSKRPSPVKQETPKEPAKQGPTKEELQQAEARRRATSATSNAFEQSQAKNNTSNQGRTEGNSGAPSGSQSSFNGHGEGRVNGGWITPKYRVIPSTETGTIRVRATIDRNGRVVDAAISGGNPPAAANPRLRDAVLQEVKSRNYTRGANAEPAPDQATAIITYNFK